ncbi:MAG: hypothetical protein KTR14_09970 [Vampirovibrio sp.]|nr:hypothetical protein [Vampirovibrio sp.]
MLPALSALPAVLPTGIYYAKMALQAVHLGYAAKSIYRTADRFIRRYTGRSDQKAMADIPTKLSGTKISPAKTPKPAESSSRLDATV